MVAVEEPNEAEVNENEKAAEAEPVETTIEKNGVK